MDGQLFYVPEFLFRAFKQVLFFFYIFGTTKILEKCCFCLFLTLTVANFLLYHLGPEMIVDTFLELYMIIKMRPKGPYP